MTCCIYGTCMIGIQTSPEPTKHATARVSQNPKQSISKTDLYPDTEAVCHASSLVSGVYARCCFKLRTFRVNLCSNSSDAAFLQRLPCCRDFETDPRRYEISNKITDEPSNLQRSNKGRG